MTIAPRLAERLDTAAAWVRTGCFRVKRGPLSNWASMQRRRGSAFGNMCHAQWGLVLGEPGLQQALLRSLGRRLTVAPTSAAVRDVTMSRGQRGAPPTRERSGGHSWQREGTSSPHLPAVLGVHRDKTPTALAMAHVDPRWRCSGGRVWCLVFAEGFGLRHEARHHCR